MAAVNGEGLLIVTPICAALCSNAVADMCGVAVDEYWNGGSTVGLVLGFPCCKNDWSKFSGNSCEVGMTCGGPVPASPIGG